MEDRNIIVAMLMIGVLALSAIFYPPEADAANIVREAFACLAGLATGVALSKQKE